MSRERSKNDAATDALRDLAMRHPGTVETVACKGTAIESRRFSIGTKAFLFVGAKSVMVKLAASKGEAERLAAMEPDRYRIGASGWATIVTGDGKTAPLALLRRWIDESHDSVAANVVAKKKPVAAAKPKRRPRQA